jgi:putative aldouronate transport system substrate-binding protein
MKKRFFTFLLAVLMVCLCGCSEKKEKDIPLAYDNLKSEALEPVELQIYVHGTIPSFGKDAIEGMLEQINLATKETINVLPVLNWIPYETYDMKIPQIIASDEKIDAFSCYSPQPYMDMGLCMDVTNLFKQHAPAYYNELMNNDMGRDYLMNCTSEGKLFAIPYNGISNPRLCVVTKEEMARKYAPDGLETLEDYGEFLKRIKENESGVTPGLAYSFEFFQAYMEGNGYCPTMSTFLYSKWDHYGEALYAMEQTPEFIDAFELLKVWKNKGYLLKSNQDGNQYPVTSNFLASRLMHMDNVGDLFTFTSQPSDVQLKVIPLYMQSLHLINSSARGVAVASTCAKPERLMMFLEWLHLSQKNYDLFMYGKEGVNFVLQNGNMVIDHTVKPLDVWKYLGAQFFHDYRYERLTTNVDPNFRKIYLDASFTNVKTNGEMREQIQQAREINKVSEEEVEKENPQASAIMNTYFDNFDRFFNSIDSGVFRMTLDELKEKQKEAGIDKALEIYQKEMGITN